MASPIFFKGSWTIAELEQITQVIDNNPDLVFLDIPSDIPGDEMPEAEDRQRHIHASAYHSATPRDIIIVSGSFGEGKSKNDLKAKL